jgi:hypothetical protein
MAFATAEAAALAVLKAVLAVDVADAAAAEAEAATDEAFAEVAFELFAVVTAAADWVRLV